MANPFDRLKRTVFRVVEKQMGYRAEWNNITEPCLFNYPTGTQDLSGAAFAPLNFVMEFRSDRFPGLWDFVRDGDNQEVVIHGLENYPNGRRFYTRQAVSDFDGETMQILLEPVGS